MKYETVFIMVRVMVHADHKNLADMVAELENSSTITLTDTPNINILETEILLSRVPNPKVNKIKNLSQG